MEIICFEEQEHKRDLRRGRHGRRFAYRANLAGNFFKSLIDYQHDEGKKQLIP